VVWVYRDCPRKSDVEGCDNDSGAGLRSKFTTGYLPAQTTIFIVISGEGGGGGSDKGKYRLHVTEQPVTLFYYEGFGSAAAPGLDDSLGGLQTIAAGADMVKWQRCTPGVASGCDAVMPSHSGGGYAYAGDGNNATLTVAILRTQTFDLSGLTLARAQYDVRYVHGNAGDSGKVDALNNGVSTGFPNYYLTTSSSGRTFIDMAKGMLARTDFTFNDGGTGGGNLSIDDIYIYGY
jgi:hypothetical protein